MIQRWFAAALLACLLVSPSTRGASVLAGIAVAASTPTPTRAHTPATTSPPGVARTPTATFIPVTADGTGNSLICRGGTLQGFPCAGDADCAGGGICTRLGAARLCKNQVYCQVSSGVVCTDNLDCPLWPGNADDYCPVTNPDPDHFSCAVDGDCGVCDSGLHKGWGCLLAAPGTTCDPGACAAGGSCINGANGCEGNRPFISQGAAHDHVADEVLGSIDFAARGRNFATAQTLRSARGVAFDTSARTLFVGDLQRVLAFTGADLEQSFGSAFYILGQRDSYQQWPNGLTGDQTVDWLSGNLSVNTLQASLDDPRPIAADALGGRVFVGDGPRVVGMDYPLAGVTYYSVILGDSSSQAGVLVPTERAIGSAAGIAVMNRCVGGTTPGAACPCATGVCALTVAVADSVLNRVAVWVNPSTDALPNAYLGQPDGTTTTCNTGGVTAQSLCGPRGVAFASDGSLFVADTNNHRVLRYPAALATQAAATQVIGQLDFASNAAGTSQTALYVPAGIGVTHTGDLVIADSANHRVVQVTPSGNGPAFSRVYGQAGFTTRQAGTSSDGVHCDQLSAPVGVAIDDADGVWVADLDNARVVHFPASTADGEGGDLVEGQPDCATANPNQPGNPSFDIGNSGGIAFVDATFPAGVCVGDTANSRFECWSDYTTARGSAPAALQIGQTSFQGFKCNQGRIDPGAATLCNPQGAAFTSTGNKTGLFIADTGNGRVTRYAAPLFDAMPATDVYGQLGAQVGSCSISATGLCYPTAVRASASGNIWIADYLGGRVVLACNAADTLDGLCTNDNSNDLTFDAVLGKPDLDTGTQRCGDPAATTLCRPYDVYDDEAHRRVLVTDTSAAHWCSTEPHQSCTEDRSCASGGVCIGGARLLIYDYPIHSGMAASAVIGIPSGSLSTWADAEFGICHGGAHDGESCHFINNELWMPDGAKSCVGGTNAFSDCASDGDCPRGICGCGAGAWCDFSRGLGIGPERVTVHPTRDIVYVTRAVGMYEFLGPLRSGMAADKQIGGEQMGRHTFSGMGAGGFTQCQFNYAGGGLEFDPSGNLWMVQGATAEITTAVYILHDPAPAELTTTATPGPTGMATLASPSPTPSATRGLTMTPATSPLASQTAVATHTPTATAAPSATPARRCIGDCDGSGDVTVDELITMVNVALASLPRSACPNGDADGDGAITVNEIIAAVGVALRGCPAGAVSQSLALL